MDIYSFERKIEKYGIVTFDIFDTLLKRDVLHPADVFEIVKRIYKNRYQEDIDFKNIRMKAEKVAREKSCYAEVTLDEIYEIIGFPFKEKLKSIEVETESKVLHQNYAIKKFFDKCIEHGKTVYIISDMYLPKSFLDDILQREGYAGYRDIILSADYRKTKRSGELYSAFLEKYGIKAKEVIHIGDSWYADYLGAKKSGISAIHIHRLKKNTLYMEVPCDNVGLGKRSLFAFINNRASGFSKRSELLGYEVLGPIIYGYCLWIHKCYERIDQSSTGLTSLWFAARDMFLFNEAYKFIFGDEVKLDYIYISRKSLRPVLTMTTGDITESGNSFPRGNCSVEQIIKRMGYTLDDIVKTKDFDAGRLIDPRRLWDYPDVKIAMSSPRILEKERKLGEYGLKYLKKHGLEDSKIVLADVGWHGTTQYVLQRICDAIGSSEKIYGLYLGCLDSTNDRIGKENYKAYVFNEEENSHFAKGILLFESLILAPHGSTVRYRIEDGEVVPVFGEPDNLTDFLISVQSGAMNFVKDYKNSILSSNVSLSPSICTEAFCNLTMKPLKDELDTIGQMDYDDFELGKMAAPKPLIVYMAHPKKLYHDLKHSPWRIGFMYKLFKIRLPYGRIYSFVRGGIEQKNIIARRKWLKEDKSFFLPLSQIMNIDLKRYRLRKNYAA